MGSPRGSSTKLIFSTKMVPLGTINNGKGLESICLINYLFNVFLLNFPVTFAPNCNTAAVSPGIVAKFSRMIQNEMDSLTLVRKFISLVLLKPLRSTSAFWKGLYDSFQMKPLSTNIRSFRKLTRSVF